MDGGEASVERRRVAEQALLVASVGAEIDKRSAPALGRIVLLAMPQPDPRAKRRDLVPATQAVGTPRPR